MEFHRLFSIHLALKIRLIGFSFSNFEEIEIFFFFFFFFLSTIFKYNYYIQFNRRKRNVNNFNGLSVEKL